MGCGCLESEIDNLFFNKSVTLVEIWKRTVCGIGIYFAIDTVGYAPVLCGIGVLMSFIPIMAGDNTLYI